MAGKDYGPKGCCGPSAYAAFAVLLWGFGFTLFQIVRWIA